MYVIVINIVAKATYYLLLSVLDGPPVSKKAKRTAKTDEGN